MSEWSLTEEVGSRSETNSYVYLRALRLVAPSAADRNVCNIEMRDVTVD